MLVTEGMMEEVFMPEADCKQPMLKPMVGMLRRKMVSKNTLENIQSLYLTEGISGDAHLAWLCTSGVLSPQANPLARLGLGTLAAQLL